MSSVNCWITVDLELINLHSLYGYFVCAFLPEESSEQLTKFLKKFIEVFHLAHLHQSYPLCPPPSRP